MQATQADEDRILPLEYGFNFRDFGGYAVAGGKAVKRGMLYRAGVMAFVEEAGRERLAALGIVAICDLRSSKERLHRPTRWHEGLDIEYWARDHGDTSADLISVIEGARADAAAMRAVMIELYRDIAYDYAPSYRALFGLLMQGKAPLVVNCSAGKDRTGAAAAIVLSALGVSRETLLADYLLTARADFNFLMSHTRRWDQPAPPAETLAPLLAADPAYLEALFGAIERRSGSIAGYLEQELGVGAADVERLRALLLDA